MLAQEELVNLLRPGRKAEKTDADEAEVGGAEAGEVDASDDAPTGPTGVEATIDRVLHTLHLPSRADTEALTLAVDDLERRIETLRRQRGA